tara:strand:+ start:3631 stop:3846 length:216 start_codon:yes stop_codon:yes gene_type:complete
MKDIVVVFKQDNGSVGMLIPSENCGLTLNQIISKDLDSGTQYKIVNRSDMPADREFRDAWEMDFTDADIVS